MNPAPHGFAICRAVKGQDRTPGTRAGYRCQICRTELQITAHTANLVDKEELIALCGICGTAMAEHLQESGTDLLPIATPEALAQMDKIVADPRVRKWAHTLAGFHCAHCGSEVSTEQAATHECPRQA
jgi:DNA-directed RNA polymerase subunit RPC12/RpoP